MIASKKQNDFWILGNILELKRGLENKVEISAETENGVGERMQLTTYEHRHCEDMGFR